jgi:hypothetical protein
VPLVGVKCRPSGKSCSFKRAPISAEREAAIGLLLLLLSLALAFAASSASMAEPLRGSVTAEATGGYGRLVFVLSEDAEASARSPVAISVDRPQVQAPDYIGAVRHDPDGRPSGSRWRARSLSIPPAQPRNFLSICCRTRTRALSTSCRRR